MAAPDDPLVKMGSEFAVGVAVETFKECLKGIRGVAAWIKSKSGEYDPLDRAAKSYVKRFEERYNCIRVFGMNKPIPLTDIYITANILEKITARQWKTVEDLEKAFERDGRGFGIPKEAKTGLDIAKEIEKFTVLGKPGSGKTTYLKYIGLQAFSGRLDREFIPIFISLKDLADFTDEQIQSFINSWFGKGSIKAESCWSKLCGNSIIKELASVPLLLTLLCITFEENMDFPRNRAELHKDAVDALLRKWDASRGIERDRIYRNLSVRRKESMFSRIAAETFEHDQYRVYPA